MEVNHNRPLVDLASLPLLPDPSSKTVKMTPTLLNNAARIVAMVMGLRDVRHTTASRHLQRHDTRRQWDLLGDNNARAGTLAVHCSPSSPDPKSPYTAALLIEGHKPVVLIRAEERILSHKVAKDLMLRAFVRWARELRVDQRKMPGPP